MNRTPSTRDSASSSWVARFADYMFEASMPRVVREVRTEASLTFREIVRNLDTPMPAAFEREIARTLNSAEGELIPAETLMPAMMARFGLCEAAFSADEAEGLSTLQATCNSCPVMGRCWKAMRADASRDTCREFCPNAQAFEQKAHEAA